MSSSVVGCVFSLVYLYTHRVRGLTIQSSGIRIKSTPPDSKKLLTLSKVDFIQFQGRKPKYY